MILAATALTNSPCLCAVRLMVLRVCGGVCVWVWVGGWVCLKIRKRGKLEEKEKMSANYRRCLSISPTYGCPGVRAGLTYIVTVPSGPIICWMDVHVYQYDMPYVVSTIWQLLDFSHLLVCILNADHQGSTQATLCQPRVSVPLISRPMASSSRGRTTPKNKESGGFHLEAHVSHRLHHSFLQVELIAYISTVAWNTLNHACTILNHAECTLVYMHDIHVHILNCIYSPLLGGC